MPQQSNTIPASRTYSLLKSTNPGRMISENSAKGKKVSSGSREAFQSTMAAVKKAKSAQEFTKLLNGGAKVGIGGSCGAITELTVEYPGDGTVRIRVVWEHCPGHTTIYAGYDL